jgi:GxxExxY protein
VEDRVIVELKALQELREVHTAQLLSYLRLAQRELGLLFNFHEAHLRNGIRRGINSRK